MIGWASGGAIGLAAATTFVISPLPPSQAAPNDRCAQPGSQLRAVPWAQQLLSAERAWPFTTGRGVTVAVLSSGVDAGHPQLAGRVRPGADFLASDGSRPGNTDCAGLGTQIAGVIAARESSAVGFHGLAPGAEILPVAVSETEELTTPGAERSGNPKTLASAVNWAVGHGAKVLTIPVITRTDDPALRGAINAALKADVVVVAAAGTVDTGPDPDPTAYPAAYPGVIAVGALQPDGSLSMRSPRHSYVSVLGPGADLVSTQRAGGLVPVSGTSIAAGYVSAAAALVRGRWPRLSAIEIAKRLQATATPAPGGPDDDGHGYGLVNPYQAVTEELVPARPRALPTFAAPPSDAGQRARRAAWSASRNRAVLLAGGGLLVGLAVLFAAAAIPRGRRRRWRATLSRPHADDPGADLPVPPRQLFEDV